jgi:adenosyl cobinamide kinase/adenosyl cobinamide phosphate guanylyltransferase
VIVVVTGGTRSGKSDVAEHVAAGFGEHVTVVVTATVSDDDADFAARIAAHRERRPPAWTTVECGDDLAGAIDAADGILLVDSLGTWVARVPGFAVDVPALVSSLTRRRAASVVVTDEVGLAVHAPTEAGRRFADALGSLNQAVVDVADRALLVVAGRVVPLERLDAPRERA